MYVLFEEAGKILGARVLSQSDSSAQVELDSGKRIKVKTSNVVLSFDQPTATALLSAAHSLAGEIELELAWEFAPELEFGFAELARDYFSAQATPLQQAAMLLRLFEAPHYFRRAGKGRFRKASAEVVAQALAAIEKKRLVTEKIAHWAEGLVAGQCPPEIEAQLYKILFKPDKNAPEYKAVVDAARASHMGALELLQQAGAIRSPYQFHWSRFLLENFPKGVGFAAATAPAITAPLISEELPLATVAAFSIDDSQTTEIDDALSVQGLGTGSVTLGIHIAAPALAIGPDSSLDALARTRLSTVYMPGYKITMLPDAVVQSYTLQAGRDCPAVSLYVTLDEASLQIIGSRTAIERVPIAHNLRHDQLDGIVTEDWLTNAAPDLEATSQAVDSQATMPPALAGLQPALAFLFRLANDLKAKRELVRGKPETFNRPDYNFRLIGNDGAEPTGDELVAISVRQRGAPLDLIVAEAMILANSTWGSWLAELGVVGIYRSQASLAPGVKVRMGSKALPHAGIGVAAYAWSTSPLRRYTDLVNQWQIIACARHGKTAALVAPFKPKDAQVFAIISSFDAAYTTYAGFQNTMERFWTLRYVQQQGITELTATVFKDNLARADGIPLVVPLIGASNFPRHARVRVKLGAIDLLTLDVIAQVIERLDVGDDFTDDSADDEDMVGAIRIALEVEDSAPANPPEEAPVP